MSVRRLGLSSLVALAACASGPKPAPEPPPAPEPKYFVEDPLDLVPEVQGVLHVNMRRLREARWLVDRVLPKLLETADDPEEARQVRFLVDNADAFLMGFSDLRADRSNFVGVMRSGGEKLVGPNGFAHTLPEKGPLGFPTIHREDLDLVLVDDFTVVVYGLGLKTSVEAILQGRPARRFRQTPIFSQLAGEVAFSTAPVSLVGALPPEFVQGLMQRAPPTSMPLLQAASTLESYGGQIEVSEGVALRVLGQGRSSGSIGMLAGAIMILKNALANSQSEPRFARIARELRVEAKGSLLELSYSMLREEVLELVDEFFRGADNSAPPKGASEI